MKKRNGFTLIELLAVIIILAIIALIATPIIINVIDDARKEGFKQTALGYYKAAEYVYDEMFLGGKTENIQFTFEDGNQTSSNENYKLEVRGERPKGGLVYLTKDGNIVVSISNNKYCAYVDENKEVTLSEDITNCGYTPVPDNCYSIENRPIYNGSGLLDGSEEWMNANYNMLKYDFENASCPQKFDILILPNQVNNENVEGIDLLNENGLNLISANHIIIPSGVKIIDDYAFYGDELVGKINNVTMPNSLIYIGSGAFEGNQLTSINIPSSVINIGEFAFYENQLTSVTIPDGVTRIESDTFGNNRLMSVNIPSSVTSIGGYAFENNQITSLTIPDSVTSIEAYAFQNNKIASVTIPDGITTIDAYLFANNQLTSIIIPDSVTRICFNAFENNQITSLTIPDSVTTIEHHAFYGNQLTSVHIPTGVTRIEGMAFNNNQLPDDQAFIYKRNSDGTEDKTTLIGYGGAKKDNVVIPKSVTSISNSALANNELISVIIPDNVISIGSYAFADNKLINVTISKNLVKVEDSTFKNNQLTNLIIPDGITSIDYSAFENNQLTSISLPTSVTSIGGLAFNNNQLPDEQAFIYKRNSDGTEDKTTLIGYGGTKRDNVVIPQGVTEIGYSAFKNNQLTNAIIPDSVTIIGMSAFENNQLTNVIIPNSVTSIKINSFRYNQLTSVTIPSSVTEIDGGAFQYNQFPNRAAITIEGDATRFDSRWAAIGFPK